MDCQESIILQNSAWNSAWSVFGVKSIKTQAKWFMIALAGIECIGLGTQILLMLIVSTYDISVSLFFHLLYFNGSESDSYIVLGYIYVCCDSFYSP